MINAKKKGNHGENLWANWLRDNNVCKANRNSSSGANIVKSDVTNDQWKLRNKANEMLK